MRRVRIKYASFPGSLPFAKDRRAFIGISLNNSIMAAATLPEIILEWTDENIGSFDLLIGDYLHRYNYQAFERATEQIAAERAMQDGEEARRRLSSLISNGGRFAAATAISTASLVERESVRRRRLGFRGFYEEQPAFRALIEEGVDAFLTRKHPSSLRDDAVRRYCVAYQLEELAMFEELAEQGYGVFVYPGAQLPVMKGLVSGHLPRISTPIESLQLIELRLFAE